MCACAVVIPVTARENRVGTTCEYVCCCVCVCGGLHCFVLSLRAFAFEESTPELRKPLAALWDPRRCKNQWESALGTDFNSAYILHACPM